MFKSYIPSTILQPYVAFYYTLQCQKSDYKGIISEFCLPSGFGHMGFHFKGLFHIIQNNKKQALQKFYTVGQQSQSYYFNSESDSVDFYGVTFHPTAFWHLFGIYMPSITDTAISTKSLFANDLQEFGKRFEAHQECHSRIKLIDNLLISKLADVYPQPNVIDSVIQKVQDCYGCCSIKDLVNHLNIKERYLQKRFMKMVGITPSAYKRIIRFNYILSEVKKDNIIDCRGLSAFFNYYDFSHFSNDFKKYCGICPSRFIIEKFRFLRELTNSNTFSVIE